MKTATHEYTIERMSKYQSGMYEYMPTPSGDLNVISSDSGDTTERSRRLHLLPHPGSSDCDHAAGGADEVCNFTGDTSASTLTIDKLREMQLTIADSISRLDGANAPNNIDLGESIRLVKQVAADLMIMIKTLEARATGA